MCVRAVIHLTCFSDQLSVVFIFSFLYLYFVRLACLARFAGSESGNLVGPSGARMG